VAILSAVYVAEFQDNNTDHSSSILQVVFTPCSMIFALYGEVHHDILHGIVCHSCTCLSIFKASSSHHPVTMIVRVLLSSELPFGNTAAHTVFAQNKFPHKLDHH
jgi:hypothetical protein